MLSIHAYVSSETEGTYTMQIYNSANERLLPTFERAQTSMVEDFDNIPWSNFHNGDKGKNRVLKSFNLNTSTGKKITEHILKGEIQNAMNIINENIDPFYSGYLLQIKIQGLTVDKVKQLSNKSKSGLRVQNLLGSLQNLELGENDKIKNVQSRSYVNAETLIKKYKVYGVIKKLPFMNYEENNSGDINCFYNYLCDTYKKISKKQMEKFNVNDGVSLENITEFANKYKIKCYLYNIAGRCIYKNEFQRNKNHPAIIAIISSNHIYPIKNANNTYKPELSKNEVDFEEKDNMIYYEKNNKLYSFDGWMNTNKDDANQQIMDIIDYDMFKGLKPSFTYKSDIKVIKSIMYLDEQIEEAKYEYDLNKAYYNIAYNIFDDQYPIFTCFDLWNKYNDEEINNYYYYTISREALTNLKQYGINDNFRAGFMIEYLLKQKLITKNNIEYFKKPSYLGQWSYFKSKMEQIINNVVRKKLKLDKDIEITETHIKKAGVDKSFSLYNGILGKCIYNNDEKFYYLPENEAELLNFGLKEEEWTYYGEGDECVFERNKTQFKYLNNTSLYNVIVEMTNYVMLKNICYIKKKTGLMPLKIKTDAIAYNKEIEVLPEYVEYFKLITTDDKAKNIQNLYKKNETFYKGYFNISESYNDIEKININIDNELETIKDNISYQGAPGTGKTTKVMKEHTYNIATTITNVCCRNITNKDVEAETLYTNLQLYNPDNWHKAMKKMAGKTVWIDEFSMMPRFIWNFLLLLSMKYNTKLIISGDVNQTAPVGETKIDINNKIFKIIMGKMELLTKDYRNDKDIIELRDMIINEPLDKIFKKFKELNSKKNWKDYDKHICFTNKMCDYINLEIMKERKLKFKINFKYEINKKTKKKEKFFKDMEVSNNVLLQCRATCKSKKIYKRDIWQVKQNVKDGYELYNIRSKETKYFSMVDMCYFTLGFAITTHSSQGLTIKDDVCIHEIRKMIQCDLSILYTAITRACNYNKLHLFWNGKTEKIDYIELPKIGEIDEEQDYNFGQEVKAI